MGKSKAEATMGQDGAGFLGLFGSGSRTQRWSRALERAGEMSPDALRELTDEITAYRNRIDAMAAQSRSALKARTLEEQGPERPDQHDWIARAAPWREEMRPRGTTRLSSPYALPGGVRVFHDAADPQISLRQEPRALAGVSGSPAPFGLVLEVYRFDGSFISLVQDLPQAALEGLTLNHFFTVDLVLEREHPVEIYARLNVRHGPNVETIVRQMEVRDGRGSAAFDLSYSKINERRVEGAWLDLIIEGPEMTRIAIWDMVLIRAPRADI